GRFPPRTRVAPLRTGRTTLAGAERGFHEVHSRLPSFLSSAVEADSGRVPVSWCSAITPGAYARSEGWAFGVSRPRTDGKHAEVDAPGHCRGLAQFDDDAVAATPHQRAQTQPGRPRRRRAPPLGLVLDLRQGEGEEPLDRVGLVIAGYAMKPVPR